jgi:uncharacterized protein
MSEKNEHIKRTLNAISCLTLYRSVCTDPIIHDFRELLKLTMEINTAAVEKCYSLIGSLLDLQQECHLPGSDLFKNYLLDSLTSIENAFSLAAERQEYEALDALLPRAVQNDLRLLQVVSEFDLAGLAHYLKNKTNLGDLAPTYESLNIGTTNTNACSDYYLEKREAFKILLAGAADWGAMTRELHAFYNTTGSGIFGRYRAFKWSSNSKNAGLLGVANPDPIRMEDLVGCDDQQKEVLLNTTQFVKGYSANNVLLYGDRGTGKSSTIKSLIHIFGSEGLRLVEVSKHDLLSLHEIIEVIGRRAQKFILFIDDLSFEENETEYKDLKALLEGSIARPPDNVLVYATSNRRNLVREFFSDRVTDEVGKQDTYQEKLSLADRFGIKLLFPTPDQRGYLRTVDAIAEKRGIMINKSELHDLALRWVMWHNARSGRTARQFVDDLQGKLSMEK